jgi:hypothetical protein
MCIVCVGNDRSVTPKMIHIIANKASQSQVVKRIGKEKQNDPLRQPVVTSVRMKEIYIRFPVVERDPKQWP